VRDFECQPPTYAAMLSRGESEEFGVYVEKINDRAYFTYTAEVYSGKETVFQPQRNYAYLQTPKTAGATWFSVVWNS
jgi:hypothetical protein